MEIPVQKKNSNESVSEPTRKIQASKSVLLVLALSLPLVIFDIRFDASTDMGERVEVPKNKSKWETALSSETLPVSIGDHQGGKVNRSQLTFKFGVSRPQFVLQTHHHKTGYDVSVVIFKTLSEVNALSIRASKLQGYRKRAHDTKTGCPKLNVTCLMNPTNGSRRGDRRSRRRDRKPGCRKPDGHKIQFIRVTAPDILCNLYQHNFFSPKEGPQHDVKFIHMIRDPFDMAISMYLYHSQQPTPESWVHKHNPCNIDREFLRFIVDSNNETTTLINQQQVDGLEDLCHNLMINNNTNTPYESFYKALLGLPVWDGLRLSTIVSLISKSHFAGDDILRMTNNIERLHQWQRQKQEAESSSSSSSSSGDAVPKNLIISTMMHPDWDKENYGASLERLTQFILADLEVIGDNNNGDEKESGKEALQKYKEELVQKVRIKGVKILNDRRSKKTIHITGNRMTPEEREEAIAKLMADDLFGPILSICQRVLHSTADGLSPLYLANNIV